MTSPDGPAHGRPPYPSFESPRDCPPALVAAWDRAKGRVRDEIGEALHDSWIANLEIEGAGKGVAKLTAPTVFIAEWVDRYYAESLLRALRAELPNLQRVDLRCAPRRAADNGRADGARAMNGHDDDGLAPEPARRRADGPSAPAPAAQAARRAVESAAARREEVSEAAPAARPAETRAAATTDPGESPSIPLDPRFTFDRFVVGKPNELAHAAARRVAEGGDVTFNPLFLYSASGLGKTHLMHAMAWRLQQSRPEAKVVLLTAEQFMYRFIQALRSKDMIGFKQIFRSVDVLMIDDVQFIAGKDSTQEEFFHTFNALVDQGKQVVISGDRNPVDMEHLEERIRSRLQWGLVVDLHPTDYELRLGILQSKLDLLQASHPEVVIQPRVLEFLAHRISSNVRVLEGALTRLTAFASLVGRPVDLDMAQECLADILRAADRKVTVEEIQRKVAAHYNVRLTDLLSPRRARVVARPRQVAMWLSKTLTSKSLPDIGRRFGGRDHTTVIHACKTIEKLKETDSQMAEDLELLRRMLEA
ncbi:chromosomal replication initiator protein DnaA [Albimonas sp. CAU 1670]|uniref:chromosomal replication initiator protein DnaA n=1 Tax=Albimonas sp. CAU 1670 TaxID=3032599 RepID=UPI0023DA2DAF|nr:chromosomal replication initiator protein DnaA [Albimonas sp. CAU 1670]MDF2231003.1 chromosomal replication initiator protein DnaA [Albimonas sp. CAU 1670]